MVIKVSIALFGMLGVVVHAETHSQPLDLGCHGALFDVVEEDMIAVLKARLELARQNGSFEKLQHEVKLKAKENLSRPKGTSLPLAKETQTHIVNPTLRVENDITTPDGQLLAKKGEAINPLHTLRPSKPLLFINGDDQDQLQVAKDYADHVVIILIQGAPLDLEENLQTPIFFDQGGYLVKKYDIKAVPCLLSVKEDLLQVTSFHPEQAPMIIEPFQARVTLPGKPQPIKPANP